MKNFNESCSVAHISPNDSFNTTSSGPDTKDDPSLLHKWNNFPLAASQPPALPLLHLLYSGTSHNDRSIVAEGHVLIGWLTVSYIHR